MRECWRLPDITVEIGDELRAYCTYVTTADPALDGPSTVTLEASTLTDLSGYAADPIVHATSLGNTPARLVLIESGELPLLSARYGEERCIFAPADPKFLNPDELRHRLWRRLRTPTATEVCV